MMKIMPAYIISTLIFSLVFLSVDTTLYAGRDCIAFESQTVILSGYFVVKDAADANGRLERPYILRLDKPICTKPEPGETWGTFSNEGEIQIVMLFSPPPSVRLFYGQHIAIKGTLMHAITAHHHTNVLIQVRDIEDIKLK